MQIHPTKLQESGKRRLTQGAESVQLPIETVVDLNLATDPVGMRSRIGGSGKEI